MRCTIIGLAAALCWSGVSGSRLDNADGHLRILADGGSLRKNASSVSAQRKSGQHRDHQYANLELRQAGARCGANQGNARCTGDLCCSDYGYCGDSMDHCAALFDCQPNFGVCGWPRAPPPPPTTSQPPPPPTTTSIPVVVPPTTSIRPTTTSIPVVVPPTTSIRPTTTTVPVVVPPTIVVPPVPTGTLRVTTNGQCGNGTMCVGNPNYGPCCSQFFWCGSSVDFCGAGCQSNFGACLGIPGQPPIQPSNGTIPTLPPTTPPTVTVVPPTTTSVPVVIPPTTTTTPPVVVTSIVTLPPTTTSVPTTTAPARPTPPAGQRTSTDGRCGAGVSCIGSTFGRCCSQFGFCGDNDQFCPPIVGCQPEFGLCDP